MSNPIILRRLYPTQDECPKCRRTKYLNNGNPKGCELDTAKAAEAVRYRKCKHPDCDHRWTVAPIGYEIWDPDAQECRVVPLES